MSFLTLLSGAEGGRAARVARFQRLICQRNRAKRPLAERMPFLSVFSDTGAERRMARVNRDYGSVDCHTVCPFQLLSLSRLLQHISCHRLLLSQPV